MADGDTSLPLHRCGVAHLISAGLLRVRAKFDAGRLADIEVDLRRPPVTQLFHGRPPDVVVKLVPSLYTICAQAQTAAAVAALAMAADKPLPVVDDVGLWIETLHENLWRLLLDWPSVLGLPPAQAEFIAWRTARRGGNCAGQTRKLLDDTLYELAEKCLKKLVDRDSRADDACAAPGLAPDDWFDGWRDTGEPPTAQLALPSLRAAYQARVDEVERSAAALLAGLRFPIAGAGGDGWGVAQTLTARGVLTHAVHLDAGKVERYRVRAPTDAFFSDAAALSSLLERRRFGSPKEARQMLEQAILALDPCVPYELELNDA